jgi:integrase/recombinase XerC
MPPRRPTLEQLTDDFRQHLFERRASPFTTRAFIRGLEKFVRWYEDSYGALPLMRKVTRAEMAAYQQHLRTQPTATGRPPAPATIDQLIASLRAYYAYLAEDDETVTNPLVRIKPERKGALTQPQSLSDSQLAKLLTAAHERIVLADNKRRPIDKTPTAAAARRDFALVTTLAYAGLRVAEACALSTSDLVLKPRSGHVVVRRGKGGKKREVELNPKTREALSEWLAWRKHCGVKRSCKAVFVGRTGEAMTTRSMEKIVAKIAQRAKANGLDAPVTPHTLRHSFARRLLDKGAPLTDVRDLLGHSSIETTSRYTRPSKAQRQAHVDAIELEI